MRKKRIFIGSSSESLELAYKAKQILEAKHDNIQEFEVIIWDEKDSTKTIFSANENTLHSLINKSILFDFGIFIGSKDSYVREKSKTLVKARDNVIFELGLFIGQLGITNCAFIVDKGIDIPSDFYGITLYRFSSQDIESFNNQVEQIKEHFRNSANTLTNLFPSSTLAAVYFENFIRPVCKQIINESTIKYGKKPCKLDKIKVVTPKLLTDNLNERIEILKKKLNTEEVAIQSDGRGRKILVDSNIVDNKLCVIDFPTILSGINYALKNLITYELHEDIYQNILERELDNFYKTLSSFIKKSNYNEYVIFVCESELLKSLN